MTDRPVALVTGGSRGIGHAITLQLAELGFTLVVNYVARKESAEQTARQVLDRGGKAMICRADIARRADRARLIRRALSSLGRIDFLVNNAGVAPLVRRDLLDVTEESYDRLMSVNLKASFFLSQRVASVFLEQRRRGMDSPLSIVNISSIRAYTANPTGAEYCISKAGLSMITRLFAARLAEARIGVFEVRPGLIDTEMAVPVKDRYDRLIEGGLTPIARWGTPGDVAQAIGAVARGDFAFATGQIINVDGGFHLRIL